jgi:tetratricopeptide (TPR) repeat protein
VKTCGVKGRALRGLSLAVLTMAAGFAGAVPAMAAKVAAKVAAPVSAPIYSPGRTSAYADYLIGRFAMATGDMNTAAGALSAASDSDPAASDLREKSFLINILNGNIDLAAQQGPRLGKTGTTGALMTGLVGAASAVKQGKLPVALKAIEAVHKTDPAERTAALMRPYILAMNGNWAGAVDESGDMALNANDRGRLLVYLLKSERARIYEIRGDKAKAEALYKYLYQPGAASFIFGPDYAGFLERQGRGAEARVIWKGVADASPDPTAAQALARIDAKAKPLALPDLKTSLSQALLLSATLYSSDQDPEMALASLRLSLYLDNSSDRARIYLGQVTQVLKDAPAAEAAWAAVPADSPYSAEATLRRVWSLRGRDENAAALALVDGALTRMPDDMGFVVEKADILHDQGKDADALAVLEGRAKRAGDKDFTWQAWFIQAIVYDSLGRWPDAEAAIQKARAIDGNRPEILNFLGYGWIDHELHVKEGMDLIRQAMALDPRSGAVVDSLGWGYYKLGDYEQALTYVEQAAQMDPSDAEVNDHLGDVYKALGRHVEAGYEWQRVLTLKASDKEAAVVKAKLEANAAVLAGASGLSKPLPTKAETTALNDAAPLKASTVK